jgi:OmpA-OmpF porin, OOP family
MLLFFVSDLNAQRVLKKVKETAKQTTEQKAEQKTAEGIDKGVDKGLDGIKTIFKKKDKNKNENQDNENTGGASNADSVEFEMSNDDVPAPSFGVYSKFNFEPGNRIIFYDDFEKEAIGDFPTNWETSGSGEVVNINNHEGKWFSISGKNGYTPLTGELPENYTVEFDMITNGFKDNNRHACKLHIAFIKKPNYTMGGAGGHASISMNLAQSAGMYVANSGAEKTPRINSTLNRKFKVDQLVHFSIAVNNKRLRVWMDEEKIVDVPSLLVGNMGRYFIFETYGILPERNQTILISNFKVAESKEDIRSQLLKNGRFSTTGIYFNTDKAVIKPESYAVIKSVADYLKENPDVNIQVIGHTDAQGEDDYNMQLSEKRANAVITSLVKEFSINESRLTALGKGETVPVDDNDTEKGRANNRRVEFVKM